MRRFSRTLRNGKTSRPSGTWLMPRRVTLSGSMRPISRPSKTTLPFCGSMTPQIVFSAVVLPAPLAPRMATTPPRGTSKETPRMAAIGPYQVSTLLTRRIGSAMARSAPEIGADHLGMGHDLARRAGGYRTAVVQRQDSVRHGRDQFHVVLDHEHGDAQQVFDVLDPEG